MFGCRRDMSYKLLLGIGYVWLLVVNWCVGWMVCLVVILVDFTDLAFSCFGLDLVVSVVLLCLGADLMLLVAFYLEGWWLDCLVALYFVCFCCTLFVCVGLRMFVLLLTILFVFFVVIVVVWFVCCLLWVNCDALSDS